MAISRLGRASMGLQEPKKAFWALWRRRAESKPSEGFTRIGRRFTLQLIDEAGRDASPCVW